VPLFAADSYDVDRSFDSPFSYDGPDCFQFFTPPTLLINPPYLPATPRGPALSLFRHYTPRALGVNVFLLSNLTFVQDYATPENGNTAVPYPWDPYETPPTPFSRVYDFHGVETDFNIDPFIVKVYYGGHANLITCDEAALLYGAGYGAYLTNGDELVTVPIFTFEDLTLSLS
jgi:hypothetical protein